MSVTRTKSEAANGVHVILVAITGLLMVGVAVILVVWANDVRLDRKQSLIVHSEAPVFEGRGNEYCGDRPTMATIPAGTNLRVQRVRYWKDCATIDVLLPDGRRGNILLGRDISVSPGLP